MYMRRRLTTQYFMYSIFPQAYIRVVALLYALYYYCCNLCALLVIVTVCGYRLLTSIILCFRLVVERNCYNHMQVRIHNN